MATQPVGPGPVVPSRAWYWGSPASSRTYLLDGVRAGLIALILLTALVVVALL